MGLLVSGRNPAAAKTAERSYFTATAGQTTFTLVGGYQAGDIDVFLNGVRLVENDDFAALDGSTIVLTSAASLGDHLAVVCYYQFQATGHWTKTESDGRYLTASGVNPMTAYLKTPNYGITSASDSSSASIEASPLLGEQGVGVKAFGRSVATNGGDILYTTDSRGAGGRHKFGRWNGTSFISDMVIDSSGRVTKPNQPRFFARSAYASNAGPSGIYVFATVDTNVGSGYNPANGRFTAPVAGTYHIFACALSRGSTALNSHLRVNGTPIVYSEDSRTGSYGDVHPKIVINLNVGDYVEFSTSNATYGGSYDYFGGWLIA